MRKVLLAVLATVVITLSGIFSASAAPMNGAVIGQACTSSVTQVQHWRWGSGGHWRWGSGGRRGGCRRCNRWRCWWIC